MKNPIDKYLLRFNEASADYVAARSGGMSPMLDADEREDEDEADER
jgi:hypothetical protein